MQLLDRAVEQHPLIHDLDPRYREALLDCASIAVFQAGNLIFREGENASDLYLILAGRVALEVFRLEPGPLAIQELGPGESLGWSWLVPPYRWQFDARVLEPVRALALNGPRLRGLCADVPALGYELLKRMIGVMDGRLQATKQQLLASQRRLAA